MLKNNLDGFSEKIAHFKKSLKVAILLQNATEIINFFIALKIGFFKENGWVFRNNLLNFFRTAKLSTWKFAKERHWVSKKSRKFQVLDFQERNVRSSIQSPAFFQTSLEKANSLQNATETKKFLKVVNVRVCD